MTHEACGGEVKILQTKRNGEYKRCLCTKCGAKFSVGRKTVRGRPRKDLGGATMGIVGIVG